MTQPRLLEHDWFPQPLPANIEIGERSWLYSAFAFRHYRSVADPGLRVGHDTGIYDGTFFDLNTTGRVVIGAFCTMVGVIFSTRGLIEIGDYTFIAHEVVFADHHACVPPAAVGGSHDDDQSPSILVGSDVWIGARAIILGGAQIGQGAIIGAGTVIDGVVPPYSIAVGDPWRIVGTTNRCLTT